MITTSTIHRQNSLSIMITNSPIRHHHPQQNCSSSKKTSNRKTDSSRSSNSSIDNNYDTYRPLPSVLTDFFALKLCDFIPTRPLPIGSKRTAPELVYFILKITSQARISCHIAVVALIYIERCKAALPKNAIGDQDTIHRIFVASILVASKYLHGTCWGASQQQQQQQQQQRFVNQQQQSTTVLRDESLPVWLNNARMANICSRFYTLRQINQLELSFLNLIKFECFVNPIEVQEYLVKHRQDLLL